ncbi:hypothetical protein V8E36_005945 [Tilletia maclaganii]
MRVRHTHPASIITTAAEQENFGHARSRSRRPICMLCQTSAHCLWDSRCRDVQRSRSGRKQRPQAQKQRPWPPCTSSSQPSAFSKTEASSRQRRHLPPEFSQRSSGSSLDFAITPAAGAHATKGTAQRQENKEHITSTRCKQGRQTAVRHTFQRKASTIQCALSKMRCIPSACLLSYRAPGVKVGTARLDLLLSALLLRPDFGRAQSRAMSTASTLLHTASRTGWASAKGGSELQDVRRQAQAM